MTAWIQEKNPNDMPATLPNAKCGNRAVPPDTGYIPPSSACTRARMMMQTPAMIQARMADVPAEYAPFHEPNSQPEPMIEVTDAQVAPMNPISRLRPTSAGLVLVATAMFEPSSRVRFSGALCPCVSRAHGNDRQGP